MILIIDNGSQYTHLIKRNCRDMDLEAAVLNARLGTPELDSALASGVERIILSGGPSSANTDPPNLCSLVCQRIRDQGTPYASGSGHPATGTRNPEHGTAKEVPLLGICYGHQMIAHVFGGEVGRGKAAEYGTGRITVDNEDMILRGMPAEFTAWVSHFDEVKEMPRRFEALAHSDICKIEAMRHTERPIFSVQFHPEVWHTEDGERILANFLKGG